MHISVTNLTFQCNNYLCFGAEYGFFVFINLDIISVILQLKLLCPFNEIAFLFEVLCLTFKHVDLIGKCQEWFSYFNVSI